MKPKTLAVVLAVIVTIVVGFLFFRLPQPIIELKPEKIVAIGGFTVTNTILTAWVMIALIALVTILGTRKLSLIPSGFQNLFEAIIEGFGNIVQNVAGENNGRRFFPLVFAFFLYIVLCNWAALTPLFNQIGVVENEGEHIRHEAEEHPEDVVHEAETLHGWVMEKNWGITVVPWFKTTKFVDVEIQAGTTFKQRCVEMERQLASELSRTADPERACSKEGHGEGSALHEGETYGFIAPFLRGVNTDLNAPLSYALWSAIFVEMWGITALGFFTYGSKFINFRGPIDFFVGVLELVSELARLISFTFRLFGNIFAGEVLLFMMSFLLPFFLVDIFYALEIFIGLVQAFVFAMLTLVFGVLAVSGHGDHGEHSEEHGHGGHAPAQEAGHA